MGVSGFISYVCYTTNMLDTIEAFIAETYVQLVTTEAMCYSTSCPTLSESFLANAHTLYCVVPYKAACVDVSEWYFWDRSVLPLPGEALILVAKLLNKY